MTRFVVRDDRGQSSLFPERLDDYLGDGGQAWQPRRRLSMVVVLPIHSNVNCPTRLPGHSYFWALENAVSSTSPIGCHVWPSN
jgi:hypothetical protein